MRLTARLAAAPLLLALGLSALGTAGCASPGDARGPRPFLATPPVAVSIGPRVPMALPGVTELELLKETSGPRKELLTGFYRVRHVKGAVLKKLLDQFKSKRGRIIDYPELNMLIVTEERQGMETLRQVIEKTDLLTPQVEIEAKVIEIKRTNGFEFGFELHVDRGQQGGYFQGFDGVLSSESFLDSLLPGRKPNPSPFGFQGNSIAFGAVGQLFRQFGDVDLIIQALVTEGYAEVLSTPRIVVQNGQVAELNTVTKVPIQVTNIVNNLTTISTRFESVGVKLRVQPILIGQETLLLDVQPEVSSITGFTAGQGAAAGIPIISSRNVKTRVEVRDRETLVLGGLLEKRIVTREKRLPILGAIPILGRLFTTREESEEKTEIIFIIKPTILSESEKARARLRVPKGIPGGAIAPEANAADEAVHGEAATTRSGD